MNIENLNLKNIFKFSLPFALESGFVQVSILINTLAVSTLGPSALAPVGAMGIVLMLLYCFSIQVATSCQIIIARMREDNEKNVKSVIFNSLFLSLLITFVIAFIYFVFKEEIATKMSLKGEALKNGVDYLKIRVFGSLFFALSVVLMKSLKARGMAKKVLFGKTLYTFMIIISNVLVIKFGYGVKGIAYATVFCEFFELLYYLTLNKISFEKIDKTILNEIMEIYKQCIAGVLSHRIGVIIFTSIASTLGEDLYSIHVMCCQIAFFINAFGLGIAEGLLVLFGMSISTFDEKIVKNNLKTLKKSSYVGTFLLILIALLVSYPFLKFMSDNKNMEIVLIYMGIFMFEILFECLSNPMEAMLNVAKEVRFVKMVNFLSVFFIRNITIIILLYVFNFGIYGVAMALVFDYFIRTLVYYHKMNKNLNWINYN